VIWSIYGLKIDYNTVNYKKNITSPKLRHQNDVTIFSIFKPLPQQIPGCAPVCSALLWLKDKIV